MGFDVGLREVCIIGSRVGLRYSVGCDVGFNEGICEGILLGVYEGSLLGLREGCRVVILTSAHSLHS